MRLTRRQTFAGLGFASGVLLISGPAAAALLGGPLARQLRSQSYRDATQQAAEGPFYLEERLERSSIAEGRPGLPLVLELDLVEAKDGTALPGIRVDIWQADAAGCYSGFQCQGDERATSTIGQRFLRGTQYADTLGKVRFTTIYPGWYAGRTAHIHFKVFENDDAVFVGQIYFPDDLNRFVFTTVPPYSTRARRRDTLNREDRVLARAGAKRGLFAAIRTTGARLGASLTIAVERQRA